MKIFRRNYFEIILNGIRDIQKRWLIVLWSYCIIFVGISILSVSNPFRLFLPAVVFPLPVEDARTEVELYSISNTTGKPISVTRKIYLDKADVEKSVRRISFEVGRLPEFDGFGADEYREIAVLPEFAYALRNVWLRNDAGKYRLILDLRSESLQNEMNKFLKEHSVQDFQEQMSYFDGYFQVLTMSLFRVHRDIQKISFRIDGRRDRWPGMSFDLSRVYKTEEMRIEGF